MHEPGGAPWGDDAARDREPTNRIWVHPSELGLQSRTRSDRRRGTWLASGLVLTGIGLLAFGAAIGLGSSHAVVKARSSPTETFSATLVEVTALTGSGSRTATGVVVDDAGHVAVLTSAVADAEELWAGIGGQDPSLIHGVVSDDTTGISVFTMPEGTGRPAPVGRHTTTGDELLVAHSGRGEAAATVEHALVEATDQRLAGSSATTLTLIRIRPHGADTAGPPGTATSLPVSTTALVTTVGRSPGQSTRSRVADDGAAFDPRGRFVGLVVRVDGSHRALLPAATVLKVVEALTR